MTRTLEINRVHLGDCLKLMKQLPDKSANLIICDPPYFRVKGDFDFVLTWEEWIKLHEDLARECKRVMADNGTLFIWGDRKRIAYQQVIFDKSFRLENCLVWEKPNSFTEMFTESLRSFPERGFERLLMYSQDTYNLTKCVCKIRGYIRAEIMRAKGRIVFKEVNMALGTATNGGGVASACLSLDKAEPAMMTAEMYDKLKSWLNASNPGEYLRKEYEELRKEYEELRKEYEELRRPFNNYLKLTDVLRFSNGNPSRYDHDTVKPEKLTRALILTCSRKNDLVLVPFAGSGTECAMAAKEGRRFIGFDVNPKYVDMANERADQHLNQKQISILDFVE